MIFSEFFSELDDNDYYPHHTLFLVYSWKALCPADVFFFQQIYLKNKKNLSKIRRMQAFERFCLSQFVDTFIIAEILEGVN